MKTQLSRRQFFTAAAAIGASTAVAACATERPASPLEQMRVVKAGGLDIAVYESSGKGPAVVLVHGNSSSALAYRHQMDSDLGRKYRMVAFDLPGHGASARAEDPARTYTLPGYAAVVTSLSAQLGLQDAVYAGWSLGGHIMLEASPDLPGMAGLMIFGTPPLAFPPAGDAFKPVPEMGSTFKADLNEAEMDAYVTSFFRPGIGELPESFRKDIRRTDGRARAALGASIRPDGYRDEIAVVAKLGKPLAILHGEQEQLVNGDYFRKLTIPSLWRNAVQVVPDAGHAIQWEQPERFNELLAAFVKDCRGRA